MGRFPRSALASFDRGARNLEPRSQSWQFAHIMQKKHKTQQKQPSFKWALLPSDLRSFIWKLLNFGDFPVARLVSREWSLLPCRWLVYPRWENKIKNQRIIEHVACYQTLPDLQEYTNIQILSCKSCVLPDLSNVTTLNTLRSNYCNIDIDGLPPNLQNLSLMYSMVTRIANLPQTLLKIELLRCEHLDLGRLSAQLAALPCLRILDLCSTQTADHHLATIARGCKKLVGLSLRNCQRLTAACAVSLNELRTLLELDVSCNYFGNSFLDMMSGLPLLHTLDISCTGTELPIPLDKFPALRVLVYKVCAIPGLTVLPAVRYKRFHTL
jgi:hypothetical protein